VSVADFDWTTFLAPFADLIHVTTHSKGKCWEWCVFSIVLLCRRKFVV